MTEHDLNDLFRQVGQLQAQARTAAEERKRLFKRLEGISEELAARNRVVDDKLQSLPRMAAALDRITPIVEDYEKLRNRGLAFLLGGSLGMGGIGAAAARWWEKLWP